jgi:hypothetical protein
MSSRFSIYLRALTILGEHYKIIKFFVVEDKVSYWTLRRVVWQKLTNVPNFRTAHMIMSLMMEAVSTSETSVHFYHTTRCNILEERHIRCSEN